MSSSGVVEVDRIPSAPGTYHGYIDVYAAGIRIAAYKTTEDMAITAPAPILYMPPTMEAECENDDPIWYCRFRCPITNRGDAPVTVILTFTIPVGNVTKTYEVTIQPGDTYTWEYMALVEFRKYASPLVVYLEGNWEGDNLCEGKCYKCAPYEWSAGRSKVVATVTHAWYEEDDWAYPRIRIRVDSSEEIPGYYNIGQDYIGENIPFDIECKGSSGWSNYYMVPNVGRQITCILECTGGDKNTVRWEAGTIRYVREYPDNAYVFSCESTGYSSDYWGYLVDWAISGNVSPFRIAYCQLAKSGDLGKMEMFTGPAVITTWKESRSVYFPVAFAHPNPNAGFSEHTCYLDNWIKVAQR